nr:hypothetical protein Iba_chr04aCG18840 [Ipomoea batatas]
MGSTSSKSLGPRARGEKEGELGPPDRTERAGDAGRWEGNTKGSANNCWTKPLKSVDDLSTRGGLASELEDSSISVESDLEEEEISTLGIILTW